MSWSFEVPGQPPSVNHMYTQIVNRATGFRGVKKDAAVEAYQVSVTYITKLAKPKGWEPGPQIRLYYDFTLKRRADADNLLKALNDAIAKALNVNDDCFLPCVRSKTVNGKEPNPRVLVEIE